MKTFSRSIKRLCSTFLRIWQRKLPGVQNKKTTRKRFSKSSFLEHSDAMATLKPLRMRRSFLSRHTSTKTISQQTYAALCMRSRHEMVVKRNTKSFSKCIKRFRSTKKRIESDMRLDVLRKRNCLTEHLILRFQTM